MNAFLRFNKGMMHLMKRSAAMRLWLLTLVTVNMVVPLFFLGRVEAQFVIVTFVAGALLMTALTAVSGFTRLLGLGHVLWIPLLWFLWGRLDDTPADTLFGLWLRALIVLNGLSLVIDTVDVVRYVAGDREETIKALT